MIKFSDKFRATYNGYGWTLYEKVKNSERGIESAKRLLGDDNEIREFHEEKSYYASIVQVCNAIKEKSIGNLDEDFDAEEMMDFLEVLNAELIEAIIDSDNSEYLLEREKVMSKYPEEIRKNM